MLKVPLLLHVNCAGEQGTVEKVDYGSSTSTELVWAFNWKVQVTSLVVKIMRWFLLAVFGLAALCSATLVNQCPNENIANLQNKVTIGACNKPPCRLRKNTKVPLTLKFQPEYNFKNLTQVVNANILGIPFPFVGVDGTTACDKIYEEDEKTKNNCQFQKGKSYIFKNTIDVLQIYPKVKTVVHWSLTDPETGKNAICFEVPARITN